MDTILQARLSSLKPSIHRSPSSSPGRNNSSIGVLSFAELVMQHDADINYRIIVSVPIDLSEHKELQKLEEKGERAYYVAVERVKQLENGNVEWRMACSSDQGGLIPKLVADMVMPKVISEVSIFLVSEETPGLTVYICIPTGRDAFPSLV